ncbi:MAG: Hsp20 family protein [Alphaproteobacteria bacterium]
MTTFDLSPLHRFTVGFDNIDSLFESLSRLDETSTSYPPYNIEKLSEDRYGITLAVAGFDEDELEITAKENSLYISGRKNENKNEDSFLYKGIATRAFERTFELANHIRVEGAKLDKGLLTIELVKEIPESMKPRKISISDIGKKVIENQSKEKSEKKGENGKEAA